MGLHCNVYEAIIEFSITHIYVNYFTHDLSLTASMTNGNGVYTAAPPTYHSQPGTPPADYGIYDHLEGYVFF